MVGPQTAGKRYFEFNSCKQQSHFLNLLSRVYRKRVRDSFVSRVHYKAHMDRPARNFQNESSHMAGKGYFEISFCKNSIS